MPGCAALLLHLRLVQVVPALGEFLDRACLQLLEGPVVGGVVGLDDLERPVTRDDIASEDLRADLRGPFGMPCLLQQPYGSVELQVGAAGQLVEVVQAASGPFGRLQCLGQCPEGFDGRVVDACGALVVTVGAVVVLLRLDTITGKTIGSINGNRYGCIRV